MKVVFSLFLLINTTALSGWLCGSLFLMGRQINEFPLLTASDCTLERASRLVVSHQESFDVLCTALPLT